MTALTKFKYIGKDIDPDTKKDLGGRHFGRYGWLKTGGIIAVTDDEAAILLEDDRFVLVEKPTAEKTDKK